MKSSHKSPLTLIHEKNMELKSAKRRVGSGGWNPCTYISKTPPGKETKFISLQTTFGYFKTLKCVGNIKMEV